MFRALSVRALFFVLLVLPQTVLAATYSEAWQQCEAYIATQPAVCVGAGCGSPPMTYTYRCEVASSFQIGARRTQSNGVSGYNQLFNFTGGVNCPVGEEVNPEGGCRCAGGYSRDATGQCMNSDRCKALPPLAAGTFTTGSMGGTACQSGCQMVPTVGVCTSTGGQSMCSVGGARGSGAACGVDDKPPTPEKPQECVPAGGGQTFCLQPDGDHCHSASAGRQVCWDPGETGEKDDENVKQKRDAGTEPQPPDLNLPNGDNLSPMGPPVQTTTQTGRSPDVRVITTVTQNYGTANGTNAGSGNSGESASGDGSGKEGDGDDSLGEEAAGLDTNDGSGDHAGESAWGNESGDGFSGDASGFGFGNSCPAPPQVRGQTLDWSGLCELMTYVGMLVLAAAHMHALYIIAGD